MNAPTAKSAFDTAVRAMSPNDDLRRLATTVVAQAEISIADAHAGIAPALAALLNLKLGLAETPPGPVGLSLPSDPTKVADADIRLASTAGGMRLSGRQRFVAPRNCGRLLVGAVDEEVGAIFEIGTTDIRLRIAVDEPAFGLAATLRGWIELDGIFASGEIRRATATEIGAAVSSLRDAEELLHLALDYGGLRGFLSAARNFLLTRSRPWDSTGLERSADDPHIVRQWGSFVAQEHALQELYEETLLEAERGAAGPALRIARSYARRLVRPLINGVIEVLGASATSGQYGFDTFWRDLTAHELDDAAIHGSADIGAERCRFAALDEGAGSTNAAAPLVAKRITNAEEALEAARTLAATWAETAAEIDQERRIPQLEMRALDASGLLGMTIPQEHGGAGLGAAVVVQVFRILARADTALAQVPQNHFDFVDTLASAGGQTQVFFYPRILAGARFGNAIAERGRRSRRDLGTTIVEEANGYRIDGLKAFCTGALTAAWVPVLAMHADGRIRTAYVPRDAEGLDIRSDWDAFGQRATFSGTTILKNVRVPREHVVDRTLDEPEFLLAQFAGNQLIHAAIEVGAAEGALDRAVALAVDAGLPERDLDRIGAWEIEVQAARALTDRAARLVDEALHTNRATRAQAIEAAIAVDEAKSLAYVLGPGLTSDLPSYAGATARGHNGIDRCWRNSRTHALHDPVRWRQFYVGNYHLNARLAPDLAARFSEETVP